MSLYIGDATDIPTKQILHLTGQEESASSINTTNKIPSTLYHSVDSDFPFVIYDETLTLGSYSAASGQFHCRYENDRYTYHYKPFSPSTDLQNYFDGGYHIIVEAEISGVKTYTRTITETGLIIDGRSLAGIANGTNDATYIIDTRAKMVVVPKYSSGTEANTSDVQNMVNLRFLVFDYRSIYTSDAIVGYLDSLELGCKLDRNDIIISSKNIDMVPYLMHVDNTQISDRYDNVIVGGVNKSLIVSNIDGNTATSLAITEDKIEKYFEGTIHPYMNVLKKPLKFRAIQSITLYKDVNYSSIPFSNITYDPDGVYLIHLIFQTGWKETAAFTTKLPFTFFYAYYSKELCSSSYTQQWTLRDVGGVVTMVHSGTQSSMSYVTDVTMTVTQFS